MSVVRIRATCLDCGESQTTSIEGNGVDLPGYAQQLAGLIDGTSPLYVYPPPPDSVIGRCGVCGGRFRCEVVW